MTSTARHVTRTVVTRRPADIDPKVAGPAVIAGVVIAIVVAIVVLLTVLGKPVEWNAILPPVLTAVLAVLVGYLRRSSHAELVTELEEGAGAAKSVADAAAPAAAAAAPEVAPEVDDVEAGVDAIAAALATADPATTGAPVPAVTALP